MYFGFLFLVCLYTADVFSQSVIYLLNYLLFFLNLGLTEKLQDEYEEFFTYILQMLTFYYICYLLSFKNIFIFSGPLKSKLQTWCPFTPKYFSIYFLRTRGSFMLSYYNYKNHEITIDIVISIDLIQISAIILIITLKGKENPRLNAFSCYLLSHL